MYLFMNLKHNFDIIIDTQKAVFRSLALKTLNCNKHSKKGCNGKSTKCITHNLWDELELYINNFFENKNLSDLINQQKETRI